MLAYFFESSLCLLIFYSFYFLCLKDDSFLQRNRYYLLISSFLSLLIPFLEFPVPGESSGQPVPLNLEALTIQVNQWKSMVVASETKLPYWAWVYLIITIGLILRLLYRFWYLQKIIKTHQSEPKPGYLLIKTSGKLPTFSFFNFLFWDDTQELSLEEEEKILNHELKHIHDRHSYDVLYIEVLKIFFWFNPAIYWYGRALKNNHEFIADASVLQYTDLKSYQKLIVQRLFQQLNLKFIHNFNQSEVQSRLQRMKKRPTPNYWKLKMVFLVPVLGLLLFAFSGKTGALKENRDNNRFATVEDGLDAFYQELQKHIVSPVSSQKNKIEGKVYIQFTVTPRGNLSKVKVAKGIDPELDRIALDAVKSTKIKWLPARVDGRNVAQTLSIPILFKSNH